MTYINIDNKNIHYKQYGKGEAILFLNGMLMSTNSWSPFIKTVSKNYNMITIDLLDQGKSDSSNGEYTIDTQVEILKKFLNKLGLKRVNLLGMSYGGKIALDFTYKYPNMVKSLILSNTDSHTTDYMKRIAAQWIKAASTLDSSIFLNCTMPYMYSYSYYKENYESIKELEKVFNKIIDEEWFQRFKNALNSANGFNVKDQLKHIDVPTLIISSELDVITPIEYQELIHNEIKDSIWKTIENVGHASMYEKPEEFISMVMEFLGSIEA
ncbi:MAG: alpha/beta hydrolase [Tissierellia bacterium]|nr:alpha/beta hydrolase [Tissierellia bacterium]